VGYPSLNLGQAIMLYAYELSALFDGEISCEPAVQPEQAQVHALQHKSEQILDAIGVSQDEKLRKWVLDGIPMLAQRDMNLLHLLCKDLAKALANSRID
jgi:tRNA/rRNA methyltransferase